MFAPRKGSPFKAGQAPTCWQKQISRAASRVHALGTACAWLEKLAVTRPRLRTEPLLGHCLEAVANQEPPPVVEESPPPAPRRGRPSATAPADKALTAPHSGSEQLARRSHKLAAAADHTRQHPALAAQKRADRALLHHLAGPSIPQPKSAKSVSAPSAPPATRRSSPAPVAEPTQAKGSLGAQLSQRTAERLHGQSNAGLSARTDLLGRHEIPDATITKGVRLAQQWAQPLNGQRATGQQLQYGLRGQKQVDPTQPQANRASTSNSAPVIKPITKRAPMPTSAPNRSSEGYVPASAVEALSSQGHADGAMKDNALFKSEGAATPTAVTSAAESIDLFNGQDANAKGHHAADSANSTADRAPLVAPPQIAQKLPKLTAPHAPGQAPTPVATATARQSALSNLLGDDDLGGLAANIKRILDAEARRYGIDV